MTTIKRERGIAKEGGLDFTIHSKIAEDTDSCKISFKPGK